MCKDVYVCTRTAIALLRPAVRNVAVKPGTVACFRNCVKRNTRFCACVVAQHIPNVIRPNTDDIIVHTFDSGVA